MTTHHQLAVQLVEQLACALRMPMWPIADNAGAEAVVSASTVTEDWGIRGIINGDANAVWWRGSEALAREEIKHWRARLPDDKIELAHRFVLTLPPVVVTDDDPTPASPTGGNR
jgi:hypothetical protein